ncbi:hypothetical protein BDK51DRAFT_2613, partial [Blyttiomyces helicus]
QEAVFVGLKRDAVSAPTLAPGNPYAPSYVFSDARGFAIGGYTPSEKLDPFLRPIFIWSCKMNSAETLYPVHEQEPQALVKFLQHSR